MRRIICIAAAIVITGYLYALWSDWFTRAHLSFVGRRPVFSSHLDLKETGPIEWTVPRDQWDYREGEAHLALSLNIDTLREIPGSRREVDLRVRMRAESRAPGSTWRNRLVRNWYFTTDEPFGPDSGLWESYGSGRVEYGLAGIEIVPDEELRITMDVQVPDGRLMSGKPRLKLIGKHDPAGTPIDMLFHTVLREGGFWLSVALVAALTYGAGKPWVAPKRATAG